MDAHHADPNVHASYFSELSRRLQRDADGQPRLLVDCARLDRNLATVRARLGGRRPRLVVKSLPSAPLLRRAARALDTRAFMVFHRPFLQQICALFPEADLLLGKPLPVAAVRAFYRDLPDDAEFQPARQLQWLIDDERRLTGYLALASELGLTLRINIEINIGMQRGGLDEPAMLRALLDRIGEHPEHLEFSGLMGYDAHVARAPSPLHHPQGALRRANDRYRAFLGVLTPAERAAELTLNGGGSPTYQLHGDDSPLNDISLGSCLLLPTDFDIPTISDHQPACFIAAPVLKVLDRVSLPYFTALSRLMARFHARRGRSLFLYGGRWLATPEYPEGMATHALYGLSSNQQLMTVPRDCSIQPDDFVFFRPTQSEAVLLQFGDLFAYDDHGELERWPVLRQ
ncbi:alanine racemase [Haliea sp.]